MLGGRFSLFFLRGWAADDSLPEKEPEEVKAEEEAKETGYPVTVYFPPKIAKALERAAEDRELAVEELIPIAVDEWLKRVGYYGKD